MMLKLSRLLILLILSSCLGGENANDALSAKFGQGFSGGTASQRNKVIEIVKSDESKMTATVMDMGESLTLKAVVTDPSGKVIEAAPCYWTIQGADYSDSDLSANNNVSTTVFTPSNIGNLVIRAVYTGSRTDILVAEDSTPVIDVISTGAPSSMVKISGDNQSAVVNSNLMSELVVEIRDSGGNPIQGQNISMAAIGGGGSIISSNPKASDVNGRASFTVRVGTSSGSANNIFRATASSAPSVNVDFSASATPGAPSAMSFATEPDGLFAGTAFVTQPVVEVKDAFGNLVVSTGNVTLTRQAGSGTLGGTNTVSLSSGRATFSGLSYDTAEAGVVFRASYGALSVDTSALTVNAPPPGACVTNDDKMYTADGGCKDLTTGRVWSAATSGDVTAQNMIWDSQRAGSAFPDGNDHGHTNDFDPDGTWNRLGYTSDGSTSSYCHDLTEGGYSDWRAPTRQELLDLTSSLGGNPGNYLVNAGTGYFHSSTLGTNNFAGANSQQRFTSRIRLTDGNITGNWIYNAGAQGICIRNNRKPASQIKLEFSPEVISANTRPADAFIVRLHDEDEKGVNQGGKTITLSLISGGTLAGTTTATTSGFGLAYFSDFTIDTPGTATLRFSGDGVASLDLEVEVTNNAPIINNCKQEDVWFETAEGGCKQLSTGLVWSAPETPWDRGDKYNWRKMVWDSTVMGALPPDADDDGRTNDFETGYAFVTVDTDPIGICKSMNQGGYTDWRVPTYAELNSLMGSNGFQTYMPFYLKYNLWWTARGHPSAGHVAGAFRSINNSISWNGAENIGNNGSGVCVRDGTSP